VLKHLTTAYGGASPQGEASVSREDKFLRFFIPSFLLLSKFNFSQNGNVAATLFFYTPIYERLSVRQKSL